MSRTLRLLKRHLLSPADERELRLSAGSVADECHAVSRQAASKVSEKYSQMKLQMKREALAKTEPPRKRANEGGLSFCPGATELTGFAHSLGHSEKQRIG